MADARSPLPETVDAFSLYNEREHEAVATFVAQLERLEVRTYMWRRDIPFGAEWQNTELGHLLRAKVVLVFLGLHGWGPTQLQLLKESIRLGKAIIPVALARIPPEMAENGGGVFKRLRQVRLGTPDDESVLRQLAAQIQSAPMPTDRQFDALVSSFVDGDEKDRRRSLQRLRSLSRGQRAQLAFRLRSELDGRFSLRRLSDFTLSVRNPDLIPGIRSWLLSALVWSDAESDASRTLILTELRECPPLGGYWLLAGLSHVKATYLEEAANQVIGRFSSHRGLDAQSSSLLTLARVLANRQLAVEEMRSKLATDDFDTAWPSLRVMRVVSLPELIPDVHRLFVSARADSAMAYDALHALAGDPEQATQLLREQPGIEETLRRIIQITSNSDPVVMMSFVAIVAAFPADEFERAIAIIEQSPADAPIARSLRGFLREFRQSTSGLSRIMAGFTSDEIDVRNDFLGFDRDVQILAAVMMSRAASLPMAIGLFGDWGTGKSHFMQSMQRAVDVLRDRAKVTSSNTFCRKVVQIRFNAWHYVDTNLWASLVSHILEQLAAHVNPQKSPEVQRQELLQQLSSAKELLADASTEQRRVDGEIKNRQAHLQTLRQDREVKEVKLRDLRVNDLRALLEEDPTAKAALDESLAKLGVTAVIDSTNDLVAVMHEVGQTRTRVAALISELIRSRLTPAKVVLIIVILVAIPGLAWLLHSVLDVDAIAAGVSPVIAGVIALFGTVRDTVRKALATVETSFQAVKDAKARVEEIVAQRRDEVTKAEAKLQGEITSLNEQEQQVVARLAEAGAKIAEIESRIKAINEEHSLTRFLSDRTRADDYRKHLGLTSIIRRDFEGLRERLFKKDEKGDHPVERVILYIDDLDRCSPEKVMDVLQAVHLLLAYDLFVVVVGVDPRWLLHALRNEYSAFVDNVKVAGPDEKRWRTTPQNYLEKIFQIPYCLPRVTPDGFGKMVSHELRPASEDAAGAAASPQPDARGTTGGESRTDSETPPKSDVVPGQSPSPAPEAGGGTPEGTSKQAGPAGGDEETFEVMPETLSLRRWETAFAERLGALIATPRAIKRFANIYRILKASTEPARLIEYEGTEQLPGEFQVPMLLLAMLIGSPEECITFFPRLRKIAGQEEDVVQFILDSIRDDDPSDLGALLKKVAPLIQDPNFPRASDVFVRWLPLVTRFSFDVAKSLSPASSQ